jgi:hypothetical protein
LTIDAAKPPGRQVQVATFSTVATYTSNGIFLDHVQVQIHFKKQRERWINFADSLFGRATPLLDPELGPNTNIDVDTTPAIDVDMQLDALDWIRVAYE